LPEVLRATKQENEKSQIKVFPNPVTEGNLLIMLPRLYQRGEIQLRDLQGRKVWEAGFTKSKQIQFDLSDSILKRGLYILMIQAEQDKYESKIIFHY
ncbi:unnamed protein product, partial [Chrysoparadoxa australica]